MPDAFFVYILETERGTLYTGIAKDVERRFKEHLEGVGSHGAKYTNANKPKKIVYKKEFETRSDAAREEARIKKLSKKEKLMLISSCQDK